MPCSVRTTSGVPAGIVTPNAVSTARKARLAIPIQIKVCLFICQNMREDARLVYWTLDVPKSERQIPLRCRPLQLAGVEVIISHGYPNLSGASSPCSACFRNLRCADSRITPEIVFDHGLLDSSWAANRDAGPSIATSRAMR